MALAHLEMKRLIRQQWKSLLKLGLGFSLIFLLGFANPNSQVLAVSLAQPHSGFSAAEVRLAEVRSAEVRSAELPVELVTILKAQMAADFGLPATAIAQLLVQRAEAVNWSDSCLELAQASELCAQRVTPGYRVVLQGPTQVRVYHTNRTGSQIRSTATK